MHKSGPHVMAIWELGGGNAHVARLHAVGSLLIRAGYSFTLVTRDLGAIKEYAAHLPYRVLQGPVTLAPRKLLRQQASLADVLMMQGYLEPDLLEGQQAGWQGLLELCKPDLLILDHAPGALLAIQGSSLPAIVTGNGFTMPVPGQPLNDWRPLDHKDRLVAETEKLVLDKVNVYLAKTGRHHLSCLADLYQSDAQLICSFPLLDPCASQRLAVQYHLSTEAREGNRMQVARHHPTSLLCYLRPAYRRLEALIQGLAEIQRATSDVVLVCPGLPASHADKLVKSGVTVSTQLIDMAHAMGQADFFLGHGGVGTLTHALQQGVPALILPMQMEQLNNGLCVQRAGLGKIIPEHNSGLEYSQILRAFMQQSELQQAAQSFAEKNQHYAATGFSQAVVSQVEKLLPA